MFGKDEDDIKEIIRDVLAKMGVTYYPSLDEVKVYEYFQDNRADIDRNPFKRIAEGMEKLRKEQWKIFSLARELGYEYKEKEEIPAEGKWVKVKK